MKKNIRIEIKKFVFSAGWFSGEDFRVLELKLLEVTEYWIDILNLQITKFCVYFGWVR